MPADRRWPRGAALIVALLAGALPIGCALFQPGEPHASRDVLDAIYDGMKRAQQPAPPTG